MTSVAEELLIPFSLLEFPLPMDEALGGEPLPPRLLLSLIYTEGESLRAFLSAPWWLSLDLNSDTRCNPPSKLCFSSDPDLGGLVAVIGR